MVRIWPAADGARPDGGYVVSLTNSHYERGTFCFAMPQREQRRLPHW